MGRTDPLPANSLVGVHVLVVDDDRDARHVIRTVLEYCGALVTTAGSARTALAILKRVVPDVLVIDIVLPRRDGCWLIQQIRALSAGRGGDTPALACTGHADLGWSGAIARGGLPGASPQADRSMGTVPARGRARRQGVMTLSRPRLPVPRPQWKMVALMESG